MKRRIVTLSILFFFICPAVGFSDYYIHLKNGRKIKTSRYWEKDGQIFFYQSGQTVGINKNSVSGVETAPDSVTTGADILTREQSAPQAEKTTETASEVTTPVMDENPENKLILNEFNQIKIKFQELDNMPTPELHAFDKELIAFRDNILAKRLGHVYDKQLMEIVEMGSKIEAVLKARSQ
ncbi:MAG: hypothetical protein AB7S77_11700 [Desulfatirhabdiaceae bacterium]